MPKLSSETVTLLDGDIRVFKRARSRVWQATFKMDGTWVRVSIKCKQLALEPGIILPYYALR